MHDHSPSSIESAGIMGTNVALVIGNADYRDAQGLRLRSPRNDAEEIAAALRRLNFLVIGGFDLITAHFDRVLTDFEKAIQHADSAVFFYAGLALNSQGRNFLVPIDAYVDEVRHTGLVELDWIMALIARAQGPKLVFLDAARSSPFAPPRIFSEFRNGLADIEPGPNMLVGISTSPGRLAEDGLGHHSVFAQALLQELRGPALAPSEMVYRVRERVLHLTEGRQIPWFRENLETDLPMAQGEDQEPARTTKEDVDAVTTVQALLSKRQSRVKPSLGMRLPWFRPRTEVVDCAVFAPRVAPPGQWISVQVFLHRPEQRAEARQLATLIDPTTAMAGISTLEVELKRGTRVAIRLEVPEARVEDREQSLVWQGHTQGRRFLVSLAANTDGKDVRAKAWFSVEGCPVGWIGFVLRGGQTSEAATLVPHGDRARRYTYAFISYAGEDRQEVIKRTQALRAARIRYFHDILSLDPGDRWARRLYEEIDRCDLFMLFWSRAAGKSEWVTKEIERAMQRRSASPEELPDIAPIALEPFNEAPTPATLSEFHFDYSTT